MLKDLQKSVEEEEQVWKAKVSATEEELQKSRVTVKHLEDIVEKLKGELESSEQVREHTSHLEAELEKHMAAASAECQSYAKEVAGLRQLLLESQSQLDAAKSEAQKQSNELALVRQQLSEMKSHVEDGDVAGSPAAPSRAGPCRAEGAAGADRGHPGGRAGAAEEAHGRVPGGSELCVPAPGRAGEAPQHRAPGVFSSRGGHTAEGETRKREETNQ